MSRQIGVTIVSAALLVGLSGIAQADDTVHHHGQAARAAAPAAEAILRKLPDQRISGLAAAKPQSGCGNIACANFSSVGF